MKKIGFIPFSLIIISILAGVIFSGHLRMHQFARPDDAVGQAEDQTEILETLSAQQQAFKEKIAALREEIGTLEDGSTGNTAEQTAYLEELKTELGLIEMKGAGVILKLADNPASDRINLEPSDENLIHAADLRDLVQRLWAGGAEGVSINGQRLGALSPVTCVGNVILINDTRMLPPFEIMAVGDSEILSQELDLQRYLPGLYERFTLGKIQLELKSAENLTLPVYTGRLTKTYLLPTE